MNISTKLKLWSARAKNTTAALLFFTAYAISVFAPFIPVQTVSAAQVCTIDQQGANDEPGQKDLTRYCNNGVSGGVLSVSWGWDEVAWSGSNTGDACVLFDTDNDNKVNHAVCVTVAGNPAAQVANSPRIYSCTDNDVDNCTGAVLRVAPYATSCTVGQQATDPFSGPQSKDTGAGYPNDTVASCLITVAEIGNAVNPKDVCSYPSQQPTSDPSDCIVISTGGASPVLELKKDIAPNSDSGRFNLKIDLPGHGNDVSANNVGDGGTTGEVAISGSSFVVEETAYAGTSLGNYDTLVQCRDDEDAGAAPFFSESRTGSTSRSATVQIPRDVVDITCTFINTRKTGNVMLVKNVINNNGGQLGANSFGLSIGALPVASGQIVALPAGVPVVLGEAGAVGYAFVSITGTGCPSVLGGTVTPVYGQTITCTITNDDQPATLIVNKVLIKDNGGSEVVQNFSYTVNAGAAVSFEADASNSHTLSAGTYTVAETVDSRYTTTYGNSQNGNANCTNLVILNGATATCTITNNDKPGTITLNKTVTSAYGGTKTPADFTPSLTGQQNVTWGVPISVNAGTYLAGETNVPGYASQGWEGDCAVNGTVTVGNGQHKICSITNVDLPSSLGGKKYIANTDLTWVSAGEQPVANWTVYLDQNQNNQLDPGEVSTITDANGNYNFTGLSVSVDYYVKEIIPTLSGWEQISGVANPVIISTVGGSSTNNDFTNKAYGTLTIMKQIEPSSDNGRFTLLIDEAIKASNVGDGGTTGSIKVEAGTHTFSETAGAGTNLSNYTTSFGCGPAADDIRMGANGSTGSIVIRPGDALFCTFTNTRKMGTVKVIKQVVNDNGGTKTAANFTFTNNDGEQQSFIATIGDNGARTITLPVGSSFSIAEPQANLDGYVTNYMGICSGIVTETEQTCTIMNDDRKPSLSLVKKVVNQYGGEAVASDWLVAAVSATTGQEIRGTGSASSGDTFKIGTYTLIETPTNATSGRTNQYTASKWKCNGETLAMDTITVALGQVISCEITNSDTPSTITGSKYILDTKTTLYSDQSQAGGWTIHLYSGQGEGQVDWTYVQSTTTAADGSYSFTGLRAGLYKVVEVLKTGWVQIFGGETSFNVGMGEVYGDDLDEDETDFGNMQLGELTVIKDVQPDSTQAFSFRTNLQHDELGRDLSFSLTDDGSNLGTNTKTFKEIQPGTYVISENTTSDWKLDTAVCTGTGVTTTRDGVKLTVTLAAGAVATCSFVNSFIPQVLADTFTMPTLTNTGTNTQTVFFLATLIVLVAISIALYRHRDATL